jgi:DNA repair exonuclease SbcCD ATPase subunit
MLGMKYSGALAITLAALIAGLVGYALGRAHHDVSSVASVRVGQLEQENHELKARLDKLQSEAAALKDRNDSSQDSRSESSPRPPVSGKSVIPENLDTNRGLRESLASANRTMEEWRAHAAELRTHLDEAREEQKRLQAVESDLTEQISSLKRLVETKDTELGRKDDQLAALEAANRKLRESAGTAGEKAKQIVQTSNELQEIYRRRESYLNTLISRYRELTEQYRGFSSVLENRRGPEGTPGAGISIAGPELSRIQSTIQLAEEDLRQLTALNAQAVRLQKKLASQ